MRNLNNGELLTAEELKEIRNNYVLSKHAVGRILERHQDLNINDAIINSNLAYFNTDGTINVAINNYEYFVFAKCNDKFVAITFKEKSQHNIDVYTKRIYAMLGKQRKCAR